MDDSATNKVPLSSHTATDATKLWIGTPTARPPPDGDYDHDNDVDLDDLSPFRACFNGPNRIPTLRDSCADVDLDGDRDVDPSEFGILQGCFKGPNRRAKCGQ